MKKYLWLLAVVFVLASCSNPQTASIKPETEAIKPETESSKTEDDCYGCEKIIRDNRKLLAQEAYTKEAKEPVVAELVVAEPAAPETEKLVPNGAVYMIQPYLDGERLVFDDKDKGLKKEGLTSGTEKILARLTQDLPDPANGYKLYFSNKPFPGHTLSMTWRKKSGTYNYYYCEEYEQLGGLCPQLFKYFPELPQKLYLKAEARDGVE